MGRLDQGKGLTHTIRPKVIDAKGHELVPPIGNRLVETHYGPVPPAGALTCVNEAHGRTADPAEWRYCANIPKSL